VTANARTTVVTIAGASMSPTLPLGTRVLVATAEPPTPPPAVGDVVLLAAHPRPIIHRVVHVARAGDSHAVYHRGDAGGGIGVACGGTLLGTVVAVLEAAPGADHSVAAVPPRLLASFHRARRRAQLDALLRRLGLRRRSLPQWAQRAASLLLR